MKVEIVEDSLEYVTDEVVGQEKWYYHPSDKSYMRLDKGSKNMSSHVLGRFLPTNPDECKSNATRALIAHWRKHGSNDNNL